MASSYKLLSVFGISIEVHWSLLLLLFVVLLFSSYLFLIWIFVFLFVTLHELTHSLVAKRIGIRVRKIVLIAIGGVAMMDVSNVKPIDEIRMAIAGPIFNFAVCALMLLISSAISYPLVPQTQVYLSSAEQQMPLLDAIWVSIFWVNLLLGSFNLFIPAFPLDGGRVLRGLLALKMDYIAATDLARKVSYGLAVGLLLVSLFTGFGNTLWMLIISLFIVVGATSEYRNLLTNTALRRLNLSKFITKNYITLKPSESLASAATKLRNSNRTSAVVATKPIKILNLNDMIAVKKVDWTRAKVGQIAVSVKSISIGTHPDDVLQKMQEIGRGMIPVSDKGKIIGVIQYDDLDRAVKISQILN